jgi:hypothetical protein
MKKMFAALAVLGLLAGTVAFAAPANAAGQFVPAQQGSGS